MCDVCLDQSQRAVVTFSAYDLWSGQHVTLFIGGGYMDQQWQNKRLFSNILKDVEPSRQSLRLLVMLCPPHSNKCFQHHRHRLQGAAASLFTGGDGAAAASAAPTDTESCGGDDVGGEK